MRLPGRRKNQPSSKTPERVTLGLAALAVATAGTVIAGEVSRMVQRRRRSKQVETPETLGDAATQATLDTFAVARKAHEAAPRHEIVLFNILTGFLSAFSLARLSTWGIRSGWWPTRDVVVGATHIHHFVPGIITAFICGGAALVTENKQAEETLAFGFGAGAGLTFDEAALLLDMRDVYWTRQGLLSVQVSLATAGLLSASILALRMLRRGEQRAEADELIPHTEVAQASTAALA